MLNKNKRNFNTNEIKSKLNSYSSVFPNDRVPFGHLFFILNVRGYALGFFCNVFGQRCFEHFSSLMSFGEKFLKNASVGHIFKTV